MTDKPSAIVRRGFAVVSRIGRARVAGIALLAPIALSIPACSPTATEVPEVRKEAISRSDFGSLPDGRTVAKWEVRNEDGSGFTVMDLGATILTLDVPDENGKMVDVVFGFDSAAPYLTDSPYFGATVGRYANRIAKGRFTIDGQAYEIPANNGVNALHGGPLGYDKRVWKGEPVTTREGKGVRFTLVDQDGDQGFPGTVNVTATYIWTKANQLIVDYEATSDAATPFNIAQHSYFNLAGAATTKTVLDHELMIAADSYLPVDETLIPTGEKRPVDGTAFDFRTAKPIGRDIGGNDQQLVYGKGFDHNWVLNGSGLREVARLSHPASGRFMTVTTDLPGLQFYSGNFLDGKVSGKGGSAYPFRSALALETQLFPDSPNQRTFPDAVLRPGKPFKSRTIYAFGVNK